MAATHLLAALPDAVQQSSDNQCNLFRNQPIFSFHFQSYVAQVVLESLNLTSTSHVL